MNFINAWYGSESVGTEYRGHRDCHGALEAGVAAGIDTLEHAFATADSVLDQMVENNVAFCPTLACGGSQGGHRDMSLLPDMELVYEDPFQVSNQSPNTEPSRRRAELWFESQKQLVREFHAAGGRVHAGTDSPFGVAVGFGLHSELELLVECGLTPHKALLAATRHSAETLRVAHVQGTIEASKAADLLILTADPLDDIANTRNIDTVVQAGRIYDGEKLSALAESKEHYVPRPRPVSQNGARVAYEARGAGPALAVLAGGPGASAIEVGRRAGHADWFSLSELSLDNRMLFVDPVGTGHSGAWSGAKPLTPDDMAESIEAVRETENLDSLTLIAHGAGALIALAYANLHSSRLDKLILVSPTVSAPLLAEDLRRIRHSAGRSANAELSRQSTEGIFEDDGDPYREAYLRAARNVLGSNHQPFELMLGFRHDSKTRRFQWLTYRDLWKPRGEFDLTGEWSEIDTLPSIASLSVPLLAITGAYDTPAMRQSRSITQANPNAQLLVFPESGHFPFAEEPDRFMRAVRAFISDRDRVTEAWLEPCRGNPELAEAVDRALADEFEQAVSFGLAHSETSESARFTFRPELIQSTGGEITLRTVACDSGATPGQVRGRRNGLRDGGNRPSRTARCRPAPCLGRRRLRNGTALGQELPGRVGDARGVETDHRAHLRVIADFLHVLVGNAEPLEPRAYARLGDCRSHRRAQAPEDRLLLNGQNSLVFIRGAYYGRVVERFERAHIQHARRYPGLIQPVRGLDRVSQRRPERNERNVGTFTQPLRLADFEGPLSQLQRHFPVGAQVVRRARPHQHDRPLHFHRGPERRLHLPVFGGREDDQVWEPSDIAPGFRSRDGWLHARCSVSQALARLS